ncbi:SDR family NAD(P)-dependent oxidoreductase [Candidatus Uabimicrobium sp. HlEnr_7]|uniref:SDR family NAD(P)-dependent oxidoreductase n=1 Tax=Candidatus Uabimicrobium helgolandensis TaxID=3095367 RepID=UPI0035584C80
MKTVVITGESRGIGKKNGPRIVKKGYQIVVDYLVNKLEVEEVVTKIKLTFAVVFV